MGYGRALLQRDVRREEADLQKKATKKSLWSSIGRTAGSLGVMALTGGAVNPLTLGLLTGGASFLGGAIGAKASKTGDLRKGKFFKSDRESIQKELGAFGTQNLMSSLKSGLTAGMGQKLKLMKSETEAAKLSKGFGMDFKGSMVGKAFDKRAIGKELIAQGEASLGTRTGRGQIPEGGIDRLKRGLQEEEILSRSKVVMEGDAPRFGGEFKDPGQYASKATDRFVDDELSFLFDDPAQGSQLNVSSYADSTIPERTNVLEPLSYEKAPSVVGTGQGKDQEIMGALLEGYNTPYGIKNLEGVGTGKGFPTSQFSSLSSRSGFMDELELGRSLVKSLGSTFGLPSTTRGYDYRAVSADKAAKWRRLGLGGK